MFAFIAFNREDLDELKQLLKKATQRANEAENPDDIWGSWSKNQHIKEVRIPLTLGSTATFRRTSAFFNECGLISKNIIKYLKSKETSKKIKSL